MVDRSIKTFDDRHAMRRLAIESVAFHFLWLFFLYVMTDGLSLGPVQWVQSFNQWDARWYASIGMNGHGFLPQTFVFAPAHGWSFGAITEFFFQALRAAEFRPNWVDVFSFVSIALNLVCFVVANAILVKLAENRFSGVSRRRLWFLTLSNPVGYFALTPYSDIVFYLITMITLLLVLLTSPRASAWGLPILQKKHDRIARWLLAATLFIAPWFRLTGFAFAILGILKRKEVLASVFGLATFLTYYQIRTGDPFFFLMAQSVFQMPKGHLHDGLWYAVKVFAQGLDGLALSGYDFFIYWFDFGFLPLVVFLISLGFAIWSWRKGERELSLLIAGITLISHNQAFWRSTVRYALAVYPMLAWVWLSYSSPVFQRFRLKEIFTGLAVGIGFFLQIFYCRIFQSGGWAF